MYYTARALVGGRDPGLDSERSCRVQRQKSSDLNFVVSFFLFSWRNVARQIYQCTMYLRDSPEKKNTDGWRFVTHDGSVTLINFIDSTNRVV